ncbi:MAG TPA: CorA family divalent cation transporter [Rhodanobacteraceae bacterium]|nr:CorA family divalent cation transporter [Rhodanobacteraceae bacterium]
MLIVHCAGDGTPHPWQPGSALPEGGVWFDLHDPDDAESRAVEQATGLALPTRQQISGLGLSSRNRSAGEALYLHVSRFADAEDEHCKATPLGLVLSPQVLVTLRYAHSQAFDAASKQWHATESRDGSSGAFVDLVETLTNRTAEAMQAVATDIAGLSDEVFVERRQRSHALRRHLLHVGRLEGRLTRSRASLLGIARIVTFMHDRHPEWLPHAQQTRLKTLDNDLVTLDHFDEQLTDRQQFLLDAIFGFISANQNGVMKLLTVASVVTIPPVILAGIWGMNFKYMPELSWPWGYPAALGVLLLSMLLPLAWFKWRGWLSSD